MNCTVCNKRSYSDRCVAHKPRKPIPASVLPIRHKPLPPRIKRPRQAGKHAVKWIETRRDWIKQNWAPGMVIDCHYCHRPLTLDELSLDHKVARSRAPELRYQMSNLVPCCLACNGSKASVDHDHYAHKCNLTNEEDYQHV